MTLQIEDKEQKCLECGQLCKNRRSLGNHLARSHKELDGQKDYIIKHFLNGIYPLCSCGCGNKTTWHKLLYKFNAYLSGHNSKNHRQGFCGKGFRLTQSQIDKRNKIIREAYTNKKEELSKKISIAVSNAFKDPSKNLNLRIGQKEGWKEDEERREKLSKRNIEMLEKGIIGPQFPFKAEWKYNPFTKQNEYMHSSWESLFLEEAIMLEIPVTKNHEIIFQYLFENISRNYIPDFLLPDQKIIFEIKGEENESDIAKYEAASLWCSKNGYRYIVVKSILEIKKELLFIKLNITDH